MDFWKKNARLIVVSVLTASVLTVIAVNGRNDKKTETSKINEQSQSQTSDSVTDNKEKTPATVENPIGSQPVAGPVSVEKQDETYTAVIRKGDNQTVVVRQMVNEFLSSEATTLKPEQRLFMETVLVDSLPRNNKIFAGQTISLSKQALKDAAQKSQSLSTVQLSRWAKYL